MSASPTTSSYTKILLSNRFFNVILKAHKPELDITQIADLNWYVVGDMLLVRAEAPDDYNSTVQ